MRRCTDGGPVLYCIVLYCICILYFVFVTQISCLPRPRLSLVRRCTDGRRQQSAASCTPIDSAARCALLTPFLYTDKLYLSQMISCICLQKRQICLVALVCHLHHVTTSSDFGFADSCDLWYLVLLGIIIISVTSCPRLWIVQLVISILWRIVPVNRDSLSLSSASLLTPTPVLIICISAVDLTLDIMAHYQSQQTDQKGASIQSRVRQDTVIYLASFEDNHLFFVFFCHHHHFHWWQSAEKLVIDWWWRVSKLVLVSYT